MTINCITSYDSSRVYSDPEYAKLCWQNYKYGDNSLNIPHTDFENIESMYSSYIPKWQREGVQTSQDTNEYDIDDGDFSSTNFDIRQNSHYKTQYSTSSQKYQNKITTMEEKVSDVKAKAKIKGSSKGVAASASNSTSAAGMTLSAASAATTGASIISAICGTAIGTIAIPISCSLNLAVAILYYATKPNKKQVESLRILKEEMLKAQEALETESQRAKAFEAAVIQLQEEAEEEQESMNEEIELTNEELVILAQSYNEILARQEAGEVLSESDKNKMQSIYTMLGEYSEIMNKKVENSKDIVNEKMQQVTTQRDNLEESISVLADTQALTDLASSFDTETKKAADLEFASQTTNAVTGYINGTIATAGGVFMWWLLPFAAMAFTGAGMSTAAAVEQNKFRKELSEDIQTRTTTQIQNVVVTESINIAVQNHNASIEALSNPIYSDISIPEITPPTTSDTTSESTPNAQSKKEESSTQNNDYSWAGNIDNSDDQIYKNNPFYKKE